MNTMMVVIVSLFILVLFFLIEKVIKQKQKEKNLYLSMLKFINLYELEEIDYINPKDYSIYESTRKAIWNNNEDYPYSYVVFGTFQLKSKEEIDFGMTFGFRNKRDVVYGEATCLEYLNPSTGKKYYYTNRDMGISESNDSREKIMDSQFNI